ncbi:MAG: HAD-IA family hydrolase [Methyloprofundus sp.]|nr:HAD-IA family hydrolase [Methyloprofundus sp.]
MQLLTDFNAVIFDMDGLVLDTESTYFKAWQQAADKLGYHISDDFCLDLSGLPFTQIDLKLKQYLSQAFPFDKFYHLSSELWRKTVEKEGIAVKKGVYELIQVLVEQDIPYCLATNSPELNARECLQYAAASDLFTLMACRDHVPAPKPAPDLFLLAAKHLKQPIESCLVIEDSLTGLLAAKNANATSVLIPSMPVVEQQALDLAGLVLKNLLELAELLKTHRC